MPAYCIAANYNNSQATQSITTSARVPAIDPLWGENGGSNLYSSNELTAFMLRLSHAHLCSEHFAECDFVNFMAEYQFVGLSTG